MTESTRIASSQQRIRVLPGESADSLRVTQIPLSICRTNPGQPRKTFDEASILELAASIEQHGLLQPILVQRDPRKKGGFIIVAGERRFRAFEASERETIPAIVTSGKADEIALVENLQRKDLSPIEEAGALVNLQKKHGYTHEELGQVVGKSRSTISHTLKLTSLPKRIKKESATSHIATRSLLIELSKLDDPKEQLKFWDEAKSRGVTIREARARKNASKEKKNQTALRRTLTTGKRFIGELERLIDEDAPLSSERYEELLNVYERFVEYLEKVAKQQAK